MPTFENLPLCSCRFSRNNTLGLHPVRFFTETKVSCVPPAHELITKHWTPSLVELTCNGQNFIPLGEYEYQLSPTPTDINPVDGVVAGYTLVTVFGWNITGKPCREKGILKLYHHCRNN